MTASDHPESLDHALAALLRDLATIQDELLELLAEKQQLIVRGDWAACESLRDRETQLCDRLENCHRQRLRLLESAAKSGLQAQSLRQLSQQVHQPQLHRQAQSIAAKMRLLQHRSLANWVLAQRSLLHVSQLLEIIASGGTPQPTYEKGAKSTAHGALVDQEA